MIEEGTSRGDLLGSTARPSPLRVGGSYKSTLSGRLTPRGSPSFRRAHSGRTPRREGRGGGGFSQWFRTSRLVYWLLLITLWAYLGFYVQSRWAHGDNKDDILGFGSSPSDDISNSTSNGRRHLIANGSSLANKTETVDSPVVKGRVTLTKKGSAGLSRQSAPNRKNRRPARKGRGRRIKPNPRAAVVEENNFEEQELNFPEENNTYGLLVGPFGSTEDRILDWSPQQRSGTCDRKGDFARLVWSRRFVLIFHELSMTGAPLSMMELATELLSCGATVSAVVLSKKGGLMSELSRRRIKVLEDKADFSFKTSMKADLVIAGSAVCASWIDQYMERFPAGGSQVVWWIMENRKEYFDRAKPVLNRVKKLLFLSEAQSSQWLTWCKEESIKLRYAPTVIPLSVNDELAFVAGIPCSLNTPTFTSERMLEKRKLLRDSVRKEMGLTDNDILLISLSSINPGKGQLLLLESVVMVIKTMSRQDELKVKLPAGEAQKQNSSSGSSGRTDSRALFERSNNSGSRKSRVTSKKSSKKLKRKQLRRPSVNEDSGSLDTAVGRRKALSANERQKQVLKVLVGSVGSKSNKVHYVKEILNFTLQHSNLSSSLLWTPATTRVASLYSAADVYVINAQGMGETFGRVTIEAMAFGLPVLGTDAGGTKEIVGHNETGLLHPPGHPGVKLLAQNIQYMLENPSEREIMGMKGRKKVEKMYLKRHMYRKFALVLSSCMR
ncbi:uncharacterized protein LOC116200843 [Punica granatum]|uniref:Uncharacterized protein LOC116200843 n=1 Tax=Punica granatum TaxID=22663 RepID=A0A218W0F5_PUNGR|nr:uncharacterized protein LOC116200843 [Punica granatum]OWM66136.1 hypothetical protein CDL15_Pgr015563 [Punica granatum]